MSSRKPTIKTLVLGPKEDRSQMLEALQIHHGTVPRQKDQSVQHIANNLMRKLDNEEVSALTDHIHLAVQRLHEHSDEDQFLSELQNGGDIWEWERMDSVAGWCVVRDGQIVASIAHTIIEY